MCVKSPSRHPSPGSTPGARISFISRHAHAGLDSLRYLHAHDLLLCGPPPSRLAVKPGITGAMREMAAAGLGRARTSDIEPSGDALRGGGLACSST
eukprot:7146238-Prymnesium_polylepis.1